MKMTGCTIDIFEGDEPIACVLDDPSFTAEDCDHAGDLVNKVFCKYWKEVEVVDYDVAGMIEEVQTWPQDKIKSFIELLTKEIK